MCYVIVTARTLLWTLLSIACTMSMLAAVSTPQWLVGAPRRAGLRGSVDSTGEMYSPSIGIYNTCTKLHLQGGRLVDRCGLFVTDFQMPTEEFPHAWKGALVFLGLGLGLMAVTCLSSILACCLRSLGRKSIFTITGTVQAAGGLLYILGLALYPIGWDSDRVVTVCGPSAGLFDLGDCQFGWAFYLAMGTTVATFICALLSVQADISTSTDKVQDEILEGKNLICLL